MAIAFGERDIERDIERTPERTDELDHLDELATRARPVVLAGDEQLPVLPALEPLLPGGGLRRGSVVAVTGSSSMLLALVAAASAAGSWTGVVGLPNLGLVAAAELGVALERLALVPDPGPQWPTVAGALLDALDVVAVDPPVRLRPADARRLRAKARERGSVLVAAGPWPEGADVRMAVTGRRWTGLAAGHGYLRACEVDVAVSGRGAASRSRQARLLLPSTDGSVVLGATPHEGHATWHRERVGERVVVERRLGVG